MKVTKHAQSCLLVETDEAKILIDPGVFVTEKEEFNLNNFQNIDAILISHEHSDHFSPENIAKILANNPNIPIYTTQTVKNDYNQPNVIVLADKGSVQIKDCTMTVVHSIHGPLPNGMEPPEVIGVLIDDGKTKFYDPSDTVELFSEADIIAVPICGKVVMDIDKAKAEVLRIKPKSVFPIHFDNPNFPVNPEDFVATMDETGIECKLLSFNETIEV